MVLIFYTTYISVDRAHHEIFRANVGKGGIITYTCIIYSNARIKMYDCYIPLL